MFGTWGSQVQILPLRPDFSHITSHFAHVCANDGANKNSSNNGEIPGKAAKSPGEIPGGLVPFSLQEAPHPA